MHCPCASCQLRLLSTWCCITPQLQDFKSQLLPIQLNMKNAAHAGSAETAVSSCLCCCFCCFLRKAHVVVTGCTVGVVQWVWVILLQQLLV
jgi:hypothetical protein